jgi:signal transduction histidine kinase
VLVGIRPKLFLVFFVCGIIPMLIFTVANYLSGASAVEDLLRMDVDRETRAVANNIEAALREREATLLALARSRALRDYIQARSTQPAPARLGSQSETPAQKALTTPTPSAISPVNPADDALPTDVRAAVGTFLLDNKNDYVSLACLGTNRQPLFTAEPAQGEARDAPVRYQTRDFPATSIAADSRVWDTPEQTPLHQTTSRDFTTVHYTIPIILAGEGAEAQQRGALVVDLKLNSLCKEVIGSFADAPALSRLIVVVDGGGRFAYYTNDVRLYQHVSGMPSFNLIADSMMAGETGQKPYDPQDGQHWLVSYQPIKTIGVFLAVAGNDSAVLQNLRRTGWRNIILSALAGLLTALLLTLIARRMERSIERVTEGAVAIAGGRLDQRIEVRSSDETRLLAESFNQMTDRLREQIARETETKQFESFMRLAAMLTHDLKNAITALSLLVSNMEQQFDREEFRVEAMQSLKESTDKLRRLVAKLSGPVESLSGEYQRPRPTDLVPHLKRVLAGTAEQAQQHQVETHLPSSLVATVDAERIERVFENLVINALEAMGSKSGTLTVEAGQESDDEIFFSIADTGPGISEEYQRTRLFRAFSTTKRKGVGLGLYTCREVVRAHGGRIDVKSAKGAGATFRVVLPSARFASGPREASRLTSA